MLNYSEKQYLYRMLMDLSIVGSQFNCLSVASEKTAKALNAKDDFLSCLQSAENELLSLLKD